MSTFARAKIFFLAFLFVSFIDPSFNKNYDVKAKAVVCYNIDPNFVYNVTCRIKAVREKLGVMEKILHFKNMTDVWYSGILYYRNTNGRYAPYILNLSVNVCEFAEKAKTGNPIEQRMIKLISTYDRTMLEGCPWKGPYKMENFEFNSWVSEMLPPVVPAGDFLFHDHLHSTNNYTYFAAKHFFTVKSVGLMDLSISKVG